MKNTPLVLLIIVIALSFLASGSTQTKANQTKQAKSQSKVSKKLLVVYFSHTGNTLVVANKIHALAGGDIFEIKTDTTYPADYTYCVEQAKTEKQNNFRPKLTTRVADMASYDTIFVGYPIWWGTMPMAVFTFLESYDFSGKTIVPFCTHGGSRFGNSISDMKNKCTKSKFLSGFEISGNSVNQSDKVISAWLHKIGF